MRPHLDTTSISETMMNWGEHSWLRHGTAEEMLEELGLFSWEKGGLSRWELQSPGT